MLQENQVYYITNKATSRAIDLAGTQQEAAQAIVTSDYKQKPEQKFFLEKQQDFYVITNLKNECVLRAEGQQSNCKVVLDDYSADEGQKWKLVTVPGQPVGFYHIVNIWSNHYVADLGQAEGVRMLAASDKVDAVWQLHPIEDSA